MNAKNEIYYSFLHEKNTEVKGETYFEPNNFEWISSVEDNWQVIQEEVLSYLNKDEKVLKPYFATEMMNEPNKWKTFSFYFWGFRMSKEAVDACPRTIDLLKSIPNIVSASVSVMEPHSEINPHYGDTDAMYRCHLGLSIPGSLPKCGFRVGYEDRPWKEGGVLIFNDAAYHKAWNHTGGRRVILLFDVIKSEYYNQNKWICSKVRGGIVWQIVSEKTGVFKSKRNSFTKLMGIIFAAIIYSFGFPLYRKSALLK